jgi:glutamate synthase (NADPH/NADH) small chain
MDYKLRMQPTGALSGRKIAIIGTGSAGLECADTLVQKGYQVTIFGIQNFAKDVWQEKRQEFESAGVKFVQNTEIDKDKTIDHLFEEGFDAVFIDIGLDMDNKMEETPGTDLFGVYEANDFLIRANADPSRLPEDGRVPFEIGRRVVVIGGGDIASECLRTALRLGSEDVTCLCNCTETELQSDGEVTRMVREEGAKYRFLTQPVKFIAGADGKLAAVECVEMKLGGPEANGHRSPIPVEGSNFSVAADTAIISTDTSDLTAYNQGLISLKDKTLREGVFTTGRNIAEGGRKAALEIDEYLNKK